MNWITKNSLDLLLVLFFGSIVVISGGASESGDGPAVSDWCDQFSGSTLDPGWTWVREDPTHWSLTENPGYLRIILQHGDLYGAWNHNENILLKPAPTGDFEVFTRFTIRPVVDYQQAGLIVYQDDDHYVRLTRVWNERSMVQFLREEGEGIVAEEVECDTDTVFLAISKTGSSYTGYWSADGDTWVEVNEFSHLELQDPKVGLVAFVSPATDEIPADFDFICVIPSNSAGTVVPVSVPASVPVEEPTQTGTIPVNSGLTEKKISDYSTFFTCDKDGNIFIADYNQGAVVRLTPDGEETIYASGIDRPRYPVFDSAGNLYVGSYDGTIQRISPDGTRVIVASGIWSPQGMGTDSDDNLYVAGGYDGRIYRITSSGSISSIDSGVKNPKNLVVTPAGGIYYADTNGEIILYITPDGSYASLANVKEPVKGLALDGDTVYVGYDNTISRVDPFGNLIPVLENLNQPGFFTIQDGTWYVSQKDGIYRFPAPGSMPISSPVTSPTQNPADISVTGLDQTLPEGYHEATLTHSGYDFSQGDIGEYPTYDGEIIFWQPGGEDHPDYPRDGEFFWWRNSHLDDTTYLTTTRDMGVTDITLVRTVPSEWDTKPHIPPLLAGHTIVAQCADGYVKFEVLSVDQTDESVRVRYMYSPHTTFPG